MALVQDSRPQSFEFPATLEMLTVLCVHISAVSEVTPSEAQQRFLLSF